MGRSDDLVRACAPKEYRCGRSPKGLSGGDSSSKCRGAERRPGNRRGPVPLKDRPSARARKRVSYGVRTQSRGYDEPLAIANVVVGGFEVCATTVAPLLVILNFVDIGAVIG